MDSALLSEIIYTGERHGRSTIVPRDTTLIEALQFKTNVKCIIWTICCFVSGFWPNKYLYDTDDNPAIIWSVFINMSNKMVTLLLYAIMLEECFHSKTRYDLCDMKLMDFPDASKYLKRLRKAEPIVWWKVICYHYNECVKEITKEVYVRFFNGFLKYRDISDIVEFDQNSPLVRISMSKGFTFGSTKHLTQYHYARMAFFSDHEYVDEFVEKLEGVDLLSANTVFYDTVWAGKVPRFVNLFTYWLCSCLLLSWPYRVYVNYITASLNVDINKTFGSRPGRRQLLLRNIVYRPLPPDHMLSNTSDLFLSDPEDDLEFYDYAPQSPNYRLSDCQCHRVEYNESGNYVTRWYHSDLGRYDLSPLFVNSLQTVISPACQD